MKKQLFFNMYFFITLEKKIPNQDNSQTFFRRNPVFCLSCTQTPLLPVMFGITASVTANCSCGSCCSIHFKDPALAEVTNAKFSANRDHQIISPLAPSCHPDGYMKLAVYWKSILNTSFLGPIYSSGELEMISEQVLFIKWYLQKD